MARLTVIEIGNGRPIGVSAAFTATAWTTILEANDFSVRDTNNTFPDRDPASPGTRAVRPGTILFLSDLIATNTGGTARWIEFRKVTQAGAALNAYGGQYLVAAGRGCVIPMRGRTLNRIVPTSPGELLQARVQSGATFHLEVNGEETLAAVHRMEVS
jgi:hypothetical protein